jgi:hypothetical protein
VRNYYRYTSQNIRDSFDNACDNSRDYNFDNINRVFNSDDVGSRIVSFINDEQGELTEGDIRVINRYFSTSLDDEARQIINDTVEDLNENEAIRLAQQEYNQHDAVHHIIQIPRLAENGVHHINRTQILDSNSNNRPYTYRDALLSTNGNRGNSVQTLVNNEIPEIQDDSSGYSTIPLGSIESFYSNDESLLNDGYYSNDESILNDGYYSNDESILNDGYYLSDSDDSFEEFYNGGSQDSTSEQNSNRNNQSRNNESGNNQSRNNGSGNNQTRNNGSGNSQSRNNGSGNSQSRNNGLRNNQSRNDMQDY